MAGALVNLRMSWIIWNEEKWLFIHSIDAPQTTLHVDKHTRCAIRCTFHQGAMSLSSIPTIRASVLRRTWRRIKDTAFRDKTVSFVGVPPELLSRIRAYY